MWLIIMRCFSNCSGCNSNQGAKVNALMNVVLDTCCKYVEVHKEVMVPKNGKCGDVQVGDTLPIAMDGEICCMEVKRERVGASNVSCNANGVCC